MDIRRLTDCLVGMFIITGIVLFTVLTVAGAFFLCEDLSIWYSGQQSLSWQRTNATIREVGLKRDGSVTCQNVVYDFDVGGKKYTSSRIAYRTSPSIEPHVDSKPGDSVVVFYNPVKPAESVILPGNDASMGKCLAVRLGSFCAMTALTYATISYTRLILLELGSSCLLELNEILLWIKQREKTHPDVADDQTNRSVSNKKYKTTESLTEQARNWQQVFLVALGAAFISLSIAAHLRVIDDTFAGNSIVCLMYGPAGLIALAYLIAKATPKSSTAKDAKSKRKRRKHSEHDIPGLFEYILCTGSRDKKAVKVTVRTARGASIGLLLMSLCGFSSYLLLKEHGTSNDSFYWSLLASLIGYLSMYLFDLDGMDRTLQFKCTLSVCLILAFGSFFIWSPVAPQNIVGFDHYKLALKLEGSDPEQAIAEYDKTVETMPAFDEGYYRRGFLNYRLGNDESALNDFQKVLKLKPKLSAPYFYCARIREREGKLDKALQDYDAAIDRWGRDGEYYYRRARLEESMGNHNLAEADFDKAKRFGYKADTAEGQ